MQSQPSQQSNLVITEPDIPFDREKAFFPLRKTLDGKIVPTYQHYPCVRKFLGVCTKHQKKRIEFLDLEWFYQNNYGLTKRRKP